MHQVRGLFLQSALLLIWLGLAGHHLASAQAQSCSPITIDDLGSTAEFSNQGLIAQAIVPTGQGASSVPVKIRNFTKVCDAAGERINTSSFVSVVVEFQCNIASSLQDLAVCSDPDNVVTRQYQFQCMGQDWDTTVSNSDSYIQTLDPAATLSTPLIDTCRRCIDDRQFSGANPTTHCDPCPSRCDQGQGRCYLGQTMDICCNFYLQNNCALECPSALVNDSNSICVCPSLSLDNGDVSYSPANRDVGSMATYTCNPGYRLSSPQGGMTRTCSVNGWSDQDFTCEQLCPPLSLDNGNVSYSQVNRDVGTVATYTCNPGYRLSSPQAGMTRTCSVNGWSDQSFTCERFVQCPDLGDVIENAKVVITPTARTVNSTAEYTCNGGYKLDKGDAKRTCQAGGAWSGEEPECIVQCPDLGDGIENGKVVITPTARTVNSTAEYTCDGSYKLEKGNAKRTCQAGGTWSGEEPECKRNKRRRNIGGIIGGVVSAVVAIVVVMISSFVAVKFCKRGKVKDCKCKVPESSEPYEPDATELEKCPPLLVDDKEIKET